MIRTPQRVVLSLFFVAAAVVWPGARATAQGAAGTQQAAYTRDQAEAGAAVYRQTCAECHLANLRGSFEAPDLSGPSFRDGWRAATVADLLDLIRETMPPDAPRTLSEQQAASVAAYLLRENGVSPADTPLSLASPGRAFAAGDISATGATNAARPPVPGRIGTVPSPEALAEAGENRLVKLRLGYRAAYVARTARIVAEGGLSLLALREVGYQEAKSALLELPGVGEKVADCVLLFSLEKLEAFPVDVWVRRTLEERYLGGEKRPPKALAAWARDRFGRHGGYAQQYLFHRGRSEARRG
ncbi:MAG: c-type cytochrome [Gemmatimonadetes bacterium]|nr:c-type cytochrome [Gemmatimonadota bacterium]